MKPIKAACLLPIGLGAFVLVVCCMSFEFTWAQNSQKSFTSAVQTEQLKSLQKFNSLIGGWRGVGMPRRFSNKDAWSENSNWKWNFQNKQPTLEFNVSKGKHISSGTLTYDKSESLYHLKAKFTKGQTRQFTGHLKKNVLILESQPDKQDMVFRLSIKLLNPKRTIVLLESRRASQSFFSRIAEIGYTREGTKLAEVGAGEPECIVTGGLGTISVSFKGKKYYVCCSGCKQAFEDDPQTIIAQYKQKRAAKKTTPSKN